jgi:ketosteroid isomerase-like protein
MIAALTRPASILALLFAVEASGGAAESVTDLLRRQTQELVDAITTGSAAVWDRYLHPEVRFTDENGRLAKKKQMVEDIKPLPEGISGQIAVTEFEVARNGNVAVATHVDDEHEEFHGHKLHCQYRSTDTWLKTAKGWQLIASQVLALRTDPPSIALAASLRDQYCGKYELNSSISYEIRCDGDALEGQQTDRKPETLRAEAPDVLFVPGKPRYRKVFLRGPDGRITGFAERREAWDIVWKRL